MIFTDRKITIRNGKSSINEPVILYRGDFEVSIRFTIMESKFRFKSGVNLVDSEKASFGQLAILAPYGGNVFSEVVKCEDGTVTFTLTKEMIDQLEEVGLYSFQIRLFDYYRESRVSIPPVEFGIEVREPVASEDHDNSVNNAIVGYSIAKVVDGLNENVGPTFDADGQYNKTDWETGDRISQGKLNKIEDAIDTINQNAVMDKQTINRKINSNYNVLSQQIDSIDHQIYHHLQDKVSLDDCDSKMIAAIEGGSNTSFELLSIPRDHSVNATKLGLNQQSLTELITWELGSISDNGVASSSTSQKISNFIKVEAGTKYENRNSLFVVGRISEYDLETKKFVSLLTTFGANEVEYVIPKDCYIRINIAKHEWSDLTENEPIENFIHLKSPEVNRISDIERDVKELQQVTSVLHMDSVIDDIVLTHGGFTKYGGDNPDTARIRTDFIKVYPGTTIYCDNYDSYYICICEYDENEVCVGYMKTTERPNDNNWIVSGEVTIDHETIIRIAIRKSDDKSISSGDIANVSNHLKIERVTENLLGVNYIQNIESDISYIESRIDDIYLSLNAADPVITDKLNWIADSTINDYGAIISSTNQIRSDYLLVEKGTIVRNTDVSKVKARTFAYNKDTMDFEGLLYPYGADLPEFVIPRTCIIAIGAALYDWSGYSDITDITNYIALESPIPVFAVIQELQESVSDLQKGKISIPSYWGDHINDRINTIKDKHRQFGRDGFSIGFITDMHTPDNYMQSANLMAEVLNKCDIKFFINGGDDLTHETTKDAAIISHNIITDSFRNAGIYNKMLRLNGNHDCNADSGAVGFGGPAPETAVLFPNENYAERFRGLESIPNINIHGDGMHYYVDDLQNKVRIICLNSNDAPYTIANGYVTSSGYKPPMYSVSQVEWFAEALKTTFDVLVTSHIAPNDSDGWLPQNTSHILNLLNAYKNRTSYSYQGVEYDYTDSEGDVICWICGHYHYDSIEDVSNIKLVKVTTDGNTRLGVGNIEKVKGTATEQAFDILTVDKSKRKCYLTRIGAGQDREFDY